MKRKSYLDMRCPIARSLEEIGEWWSILILRDAFHGMTRFDEFATNLGVAPNILTKRLKALVGNGLLEKKPYSEKPLRHEYVLTEKGKDFFAVLVTLLNWGNKHVVADGQAAVLLADRESGEIIEPQLFNPKTKKPLRPADMKLVAGPGARASTHARLNRQKLHLDNQT